ncbi:MAG: hypothetical protein N4A71_16985 [Carboxylicivirga sp.]|jgi:hypothetical protein|nr:hypothetical protein [Carboxylicivirga sp.]
MKATTIHNSNLHINFNILTTKLILLITFVIFKSLFICSQNNEKGKYGHKEDKVNFDQLFENPETVKIHIDSDQDNAVTLGSKLTIHNDNIDCNWQKIDTNISKYIEAIKIDSRNSHLDLERIQTGGIMKTTNKVVILSFKITDSCSLNVKYINQQSIGKDTCFFEAGKLFKSIIIGNTWTKIYDQVSNSEKIIIGSNIGELYVIMTGCELYKSNNQSITFCCIKQTLSNNTFQKVNDCKLFKKKFYWWHRRWRKSIRIVNL